MDLGSGGSGGSGDFGSQGSVGSGTLLGSGGSGDILVSSTGAFGGSGGSGDSGIIIISGGQYLYLYRLDCRSIQIVGWAYSGLVNLVQFQALIDTLRLYGISLHF